MTLDIKTKQNQTTIKDIGTKAETEYVLNTKSVIFNQ